MSKTITQFNATKNVAVLNPQRDSNRAAKIPVYTIPVKVSRYYTDVDGVIVSKSSVPAAIQKRFPFILMGAFDFEGGYKTGLSINPPDISTYYLKTFVNGVDSYNSVVGFSGLATIQTKLKTGDIVHLFTDDLVNPNYFIWIVCSCGNAASLASIVSNLKSTQQDARFERLYIFQLNYYVDNETQFYNAINYTRMDNIGTYQSNPIQPTMFKNIYVEQPGLLTIDTEFLLDQYLELSSYIDFDTDELSLDFKIKKLNPL